MRRQDVSYPPHASRAARLKEDAPKAVGRLSALAHNPIPDT
ncbi:MAG: hypothetical protein ABSD29_20265 [Verrucomicrobiota bacterium]